MTWHVEVTEEAERELKDLPADMYARFVHIAELLEEFGPQEVRKPHVDHLGGKLWEIRMHGRDGIARAIYFTAQGRRLIVVHAFVKKTQKTPQHALTRAFTRMQEWQNHEKLQRLAERGPRKPRREGRL